MKYWLLTTEFPPIHGGGISTYCWHTVKMLSEAGNEVSIFINDYEEDKVSTEYLFDKVKLIRFNPSQTKLGKALGFEARLSFEFANMVEKEMEKEGVPDVLEVQDYLGIGYYVLLKKSLLYNLFKELKIVLTIHAPSFLYLDYNQVPLYKFPQYWVGEMEKASIKMADLVISPSYYIIAELENRMDLHNKEVIRIFNPYQNESFSKIAPKIDNGNLVFFGKLTPQKGCLEMLSYFKEMWDNDFNKPLTIIGGGDHFFYPVQEDMVTHIKKQYAPYIAKNLIRFEGNIPPDKLKKRLLEAQVVIIPSIIDNLPYAVIEAMDLGKIVLSSEKGGHIELITHGQNGFIFEHDVADSFKNNIVRILNLSSVEVEKISKNARSTIKNLLNYHSIAEQKNQLISRLILDYNTPNHFHFVESIKKSTIKSPITVQDKNDRLSVVIPYYNMADYIDDAIDSILKVPEIDIELIIINDGSDDPKSIDKIRELDKKYDFLIYNQPNKGLSHARNFGAEKSNGEFLTFLDADDTVSPNYYHNAIKVLKQYSNVSFVGCWAQYFGESNDIWPTFNPEPPYLLLHNMINSSALIYKKKDFIAFGKNDPKLIYGMEDYDSVISMIKNGARGVSFPETWWQYRIRKNSMAQSFTRNKELFLYRTINKNHESFFKAYASELVNLLNHNGSGLNFDNPTWPSEDEKVISIFKNTKLERFIKKNKILRGLAKKLYLLLLNK